MRAADLDEAKEMRGLRLNVAEQPGLMACSLYQLVLLMSLIFKAGIGHFRWKSGEMLAGQHRRSVFRKPPCYELWRKMEEVTI
ncbi:hypothetical protein Q7C36_008889 [Tachysurus vachellii]|uniref:Uncharacterized protein n=1 Tax=Tachysurus vachellii TaxID=175792 RepID=A0AA88N6S2_TACVA|nr:hypothetical protein Q7C36_008889 [Tachysurus vachellii]